MPHKLLFRMKDYDFNVLEVYAHDTSSEDGLYWEDVIVDTRYYNSNLYLSLILVLKVREFIIPTNGKIL